MASKRDYYEVLGVSKTATAEEIKRAYRKLAMQHHPDKHGGDDSKFKEIGEAYDTLKDPGKRTGYDQYGHAGAQGNPFAGGGAAGGGFQGDFDFQSMGGFGDIFEMFMGGQGGSRRQARGRDLEVVLTIDFSEAVFGADKTISLDLDDICDRCQGSAAEPDSPLKQCATCGGAGQVVRTQNTILGAIQQRAVCPTCSGRGQIPEKACTKCAGKGNIYRSKKLTVKIPPGIDNGQTIRLTGEGAAAGTAKGDLFVHVQVRPSRQFQRDGATIRSTVKIGMAEAALGTQVQVDTLDGKVTLKIPAGTQSGKVFKLSERGVPVLNSRRRGDQLVTVTVETPTKLSPRQRELLAEFEATDGKKNFWNK